MVRALARRYEYGGCRARGTGYLLTDQRLRSDHERKSFFFALASVFSGTQSAPSSMTFPQQEPNASPPSVDYASDTESDERCVYQTSNKNPDIQELNPEIQITVSTKNQNPSQLPNRTPRTKIIPPSRPKTPPPNPTTRPKPPPSTSPGDMAAALSQIEIDQGLPPPAEAQIGGYLRDARRALYHPFGRVSQKLYQVGDIGRNRLQCAA